MSELVGHTEDWFSHNTAQIRPGEGLLALLCSHNCIKAMGENHDQKNLFAPKLK